ncbi:protein-serine/threonine phosphatase [Trifolium repens]|nr:protein-serine/threonine phosphatase [Trifolium repens]
MEFGPPMDHACGVCVTLSMVPTPSSHLKPDRITFTPHIDFNSSYPNRFTNFDFPISCQSRLAPSLNNKIVLHNLLVFRVVAAEHISQVIFWSIRAASRQERFRTLTKVIIIVYDVTRRETSTNLSEVWSKELELYSTNQECVKMLIGNKVDR